MKEIPVLLASDENHMKYLYVLITSILSNSDTKSKYKFVLMLSPDCSEESKNQVRCLCERHGADVQMIDMGAMCENFSCKIAHITYQTYYRLVAASLLPQYDRLIYLDLDTIVLADLKGLYQIDLEDCYLAGVRAAFCQLAPESMKKSLGLPDVDNYINAGVIVMNLKKIREDGLEPKFVELVKNNYDTQDQDVLNIACYGKIKVLPVKFNLMTKYEELFDKCITAGIYEANEISDALKAPVIVHYLGKTKPWHSESGYLADKWWLYARQTPFYELFLRNCFLKKVTGQFTEALQKNQIKRLYYWYSFCAKLTSGETRRKYKLLKRSCRERLRNIDQFLCQNKG